MVLFTGNVQKRQIYREKKYLSGRLELGLAREKGERGVTAVGALLAPPLPPRLQRRGRPRQPSCHLCWYFINLRVYPVLSQDFKYQLLCWWLHINWDLSLSLSLRFPHLTAYSMSLFSDLKVRSDLICWYVSSLSSVTAAPHQTYFSPGFPGPVNGSHDCPSQPWFIDFPPTLYLITHHVLYSPCKMHPKPTHSFSCFCH